MATESEQAPESRRSGQGRSDAAVRTPPPHNHTLPAGLSRRSWLIRLLHARVSRNQWGAWCLLVAGLTVTVLTSLYIKAGVESAAQREFDFACNEIRLNINARLEAAAQILRGGAALFDASETVSRGGWRTFTQRLQIEQHLPGIQGIGFAALIPRAQLDQHVQAIRSEGFPDYQVRPAGERESYSAIIYLEPFSDRNLRAFGYDMLSEPVRRAAMERARDENADALSGKVLLVQETGQDVQAGGLMYVPVYRHGLPIETIEQRRAALQGWVYSPYRMTDLMRGTLGHWDVKQKGKEIALQVYDGDGLSADTLLYDSQGATEQTQASTARITRLTPVDFAGHRWTLRFTQPGGMGSLAEYRSAWLVLFGGTMGTLLLFGLMLWRQQRIRFYRDKAEAGEVLRASELRYRRLFESAKDGILILAAETGMVVDVNPCLVELLGVTREAFLGKKVWELGFFKDAVANEANFAELKEKKYIRYEDMALEGHDGQRHEVEFVSNIYLVNHQEVIQCNIHDITERKRAEAEIRIKNQVFEDSIASQSIADKDGVITHVNSAFLRLWGYATKEDAIGKSVDSFFANPADATPVLEALAAQDAWDGEFLARRTDGTTFISRGYATSLRNAAGELIGYQSTNLDVTRERESEVKFSTAFKISPYAITITRARDGAFIEVNDAFTTMAGFTREEACADSSIGLKLWMNSEDRDLVVNDLRAGRTVVGHEYQFRTKGDKTFTGSFSARAILLGGEPCILSNIADITERKLAQEALKSTSYRQQALLSAIPDIIMEVDANKIYTWANPAGIEFFGPDAVGRSADDYFVGNQDTYEKVQSLFSGEELVTYLESWQRRRDGSERLLAWWCRVLKDHEGKVTGALSTARDITERKRAEAEIVKLNVELEQRVQERTAKLDAANKELEAFSYSVSHDLRAPLRHVQGYVDMLAQEAGGRLSDKGRHYMQTIADASREMGELIDDLLAFSRMGRAEMMETSVDLNALVQDALRALEETVRGRNIVWKIKPLPAVQADPAMLKLVLANLLGNAVKFTRPRDPAVIEIGIVNAESGSQRSEVRDQKTDVYEESEGQKAPFTTNRSLITDHRSPITFFVRDNGIGFDPRYAHKLFGIFQRLHRADEFEGTGIGLANVRRIIARHGGRTWAEGAVDKGATFYFTLKPSTTTQPTNS